MSKSKKNAGQTYKTLDQRKHVLLRPDMYIGSIKFSETEYYAAVSEENKENEKTNYIISKKMV